MKTLELTALAIVVAAGSLLATTSPSSAYQLIKRGDEQFSVIYNLKCADGKVHWIRQEKKSGKWCYSSRCFSSVADLVRSQMSSCR
ncbi:MAG: hypothetical protein KDJ41_01105 [Hyphomicrobiaceae bacterium]|nr:hypothetical protein [Hyphomicrobiaceae bacterium]